MTTPKKILPGRALCVLATRGEPGKLEVKRTCVNRCHYWRMKEFVQVRGSRARKNGIQRRCPKQGFASLQNYMVGAGTKRMKKSFGPGSLELEV